MEEKKLSSVSVMTNGNILKKICCFAFPCILGRILQNLYNFLDTVMVGKVLGLNALAAVGATGSLVSLFLDTIIGLMSGFSIVIAKKYGSGNIDELKTTFFNSLIITTIAGIIVSVFGTLFSRQFLYLMNTPSDIIEDASKYISVIFIGMWTAVFYNFFCEMLRALGDSRFPLAVLLISSVIHIILVLLFFFVFNFGVAGAAISTVISQLIAALVCAVYIYKTVPYFRLQKSDLKINPKVLKECLSLGIPMAITNFVVMFGGIILSFVTNDIGTEYVAGYSCASKIGYIITTPIFGFASTAAIFVSQNFGAGNFDRIRNGLKKVILLITIINFFLFILVLFTGRPLLELLLSNGSETAIKAGETYLNIRCTAMFILTFAAVYKSVLPALGKTFFSTLSGFLEIGLRYLVPILFSKKLGFISVPLTDVSAWVTLAVLLTFAYFYELKKLRKRKQ